jgi:hypothetical protein
MATWQHLRSSTANKRPTTSLADGRIAINTNTASPGLFFKDSAGTGIVKVGPVHVGTSAPNSTPAAGGSSGNYLGEQWLDTSVSPAQLKVWNGSVWVGVVADELPVSKLQDGTPRQLIQTDAAGTGVEWTSNIDIPGTLDVTGVTTLDSTLNVAGNVSLGAAATLTFEGATDDSWETTLSIVDPTADRSLLLPNVSGTVVTTGDTGSITSTMILDGTILNADINASAAIAGTKISPNFGSQTVQTTGIFSHALGTAGAPTITFTGDTNTGIYSPGADQVAISTGGTGRLFVDASGRVLAGTDTAIPQSTNVGFGRLQVLGTSSTQELLGRFSADASAAVFAFLKSRNATIGSHTVVNSGDTLGQINFQGSDGTDYLNAALIRAEVDGTPGTNDMPGRLVFSTTADGSASPAERLRLDSSGRLGLGTSNPNELLHVASGGNTKARISSSFSGSTDTGLIIDTTGDSSIGAISFHKAGSSRGDISYFHNATGASEQLRFNVAGGSADLVIDGSGRVGIGTTSPSSELHVQGALSGGQLLVANSGTNSVEKYGTFGTVHYTNAEEPALGLAVQSNSTENNVVIGGALGEFNAATSVRFYTAANNTTTTGSERARIDSSGRLLVGTSTALNVSGSAGFEGFQVAGTGSGSNVSLSRWAATTGAAVLSFAKSRGASIGTNAVVVDGDSIGRVEFNAADGTSFISAAQIQAFVDGTPGANDMPGRLVLSVTADGASSPTEALRITNDRVVAYNQPDVTSKAAAATLTVAELKTKIIQYTGAAATLTLPTGTLTEGGFSGIYTNMTFEWSVINTGSGLCTIGAGTGHTIVGGATVAVGASGRFASRRTAANTFVTYRLS